MKIADVSSGIRPEWQLLLACCRRPAFPDARERIRALVTSGLDWSYLFTQAEDHGVAPLLAHSLRAFGDCIPAPWRVRSREQGRAHLFFVMTLTAELFRLLNLFEQGGIETAVFKGPTLAVEAFGDAALRQYSDLDLFVPHRDILRACELLTGHGYRTDLALEKTAGGSVPGQFLFTRPGSRTIIELHTERTLRYIPRPLPVDSLMARRTRVLIDGRPVPAFSAEDTLVLISIHGSKHLWDRLMWIADAGALACRSPQLHAGTVLRFARELGAASMLGLGLRLASDLLSCPLPEEFSTHLEKDLASQALSPRICRRMVHDDRSLPGVIERAWFRIRMRGGWAAGVPYFLRLALAPTEEDWAGPEAPKRTGLGAFFRRPLRLLRKYGIGFRSR
ncbi:MAG: nucleotidyltransferase family protein [Candidatus Acidiferrales bacterium]|jgi:hypothetical protein